MKRSLRVESFQTTRFQVDLLRTPTENGERLPSDGWTSEL